VSATDSQTGCNLLHVNGLALVGEAGIAGDDEEPVDAREGGDDFLDQEIICPKTQGNPPFLDRPKPLMCIPKGALLCIL
jgi:hypothetical protein